MNPDQRHAIFTRLRDADGTAHFIPHGSIDFVSNMSKEWSRVLLSIGLDYATDPDKAIPVLKDECEKMCQDPSWKDHFLEIPQVSGIESFDISAVTYRITGMTKPLMQWDAMRELRLRLLRRLNKEGINMPFPQQTLGFRSDNEQRLFLRSALKDD